MIQRKKFFFIISFLLLGFIFSEVYAAVIVQRVADIFSGVSSSNPQWMAVFNNKIYFGASSSGSAKKLWLYDGTNSPSQVPGSDYGGSNPTYLTVFNNKVYYQDSVSSYGQELWMYDGVNPPNLVVDLYPGTGSSNPYFLKTFNNKLYFGANGGDGTGVELWMYDGSNPPSRAADINSGSGSSAPSYLAVFNNKLYFSANGGDGAGYELWSYDGSHAPTRVADIRAGSDSSAVAFLTVFNNKLYFNANGGDGAGIELWMYDGSNPPSRVADIYSGSSSSTPRFLATFENKLYFNADGGDGTGAELWVYDGSNPPNRAADIYSGSSSSDPGYLAAFNNKLYFSADGGDGHGRELWMYYEDNTPPLVSSSTPTNGSNINGIKSLEVIFSEEMTHDGGVNAANNTNNFILVEEKGNGFQTTACNSTDFINDTRIIVDSALYDNNSGNGPYKTTVDINSSIELPDGSYRLFVCGSTSVTDSAGNKLNGGADLIISFTVSTLMNPSELPHTGFPSGKPTVLVIQPNEKAYQDLNELWLEIPSLKINAPIIGIPCSREGWDLSWLSNQVGWLQGTAFPTWSGNSVLTAHVVNASGEPGLFTDLDQLSYGDEIVINAWGQRYVYQVRSVNNRVKPDDLSVFHHQIYPYLTLITCKGYDEESDSYRWRVVVQAVQVVVE